MKALLLGAGISLLFTLFLTPLFIRLFHRLQWGQFIRDDGPVSHHAKRGTATMGGIVVIIASVVGYFAGTLISGGFAALEPSPLLVLFLMVGLGLVGFTDDYLKTRHQRSLGLGGWAKIAGQVVVAAVFALLALQFPNGSVAGHHRVTPGSENVSVLRDMTTDPHAATFVIAFGAAGGLIAFIIWVMAIVAATSNGVNVADGLDGLATGASIAAIGSYIIVCFWQFNQWCFNPAVAGGVNGGICYDVRDPLELATVAACITGALIGFLWWNTSPAQIFMGDTGSLGLGGALAALAIFSRTELLLVLTGGLFVIVTGSVILQRAYFKVTHGRRIFLMSPLHHHFELKGWAEVTVVVRFWIIAGLLAGLGVGLFYLEWLSRAAP